MLYCDVCCVYFFFFKQKTAYEMRISDWSSDVCSSDLPPPQIEPPPTRIKGLAQKPSGLTLDALDLLPKLGWDAGFYPRWRPGEDGALHALDRFVVHPLAHRVGKSGLVQRPATLGVVVVLVRSEERRVGKEWVRTCRS